MTAARIGTGNRPRGDSQRHGDGGAHQAEDAGTSETRRMSDYERAGTLASGRMLTWLTSKGVRAQARTWARVQETDAEEKQVLEATIETMQHDLNLRAREAEVRAVVDEKVSGGMTEAKAELDV